MTVMEREEIERVEQELDAVLKLVQPEPPIQDKEPETKQQKTQGAMAGEYEQRINIPEGKPWEEMAFSQEEDGIGVRTMAEQASGEDETYLEGQPPLEVIQDEDQETDSFQGQWEEEPAKTVKEEKAGRKAGRPKRTLRLLKPSDGLAAAFFVPVIVMIIIFAQRGIFPFGQECFLRTDMYHQYAPFFSEFQYKLTHGGSLLYSWDIGMGVNFSALYAYYLASPINWLLILCPKAYIIEFMTLVIVLKIGLSGLSFAWYLKKHFGTREFGVGLFGIFYALSGYMAAYSWNIMWLDCILLFPLILLGLERLVKGKGCMLYCITLGLSILSNYYISIMICIFMVIYVVAQMIINPPRGLKGFVKTCLDFGVYSLLAGGLAAVVLLPEIYALQATASGDFDFPKTVSSYFSIFDMIARHMGDVGTEIGLDHWPNIYCGVAVLMLFLLYLGSKKVALREKIVYCGLLLLFYASFSINVLNFIWHGFHFPNSLPCRQSFIYIALMLFICYQAYTNLKETPWKHICLAFWGSVVFVLLSQKLVNLPEQFHFSVFYVAILFLAAYGGLIYQYKKGRWSLDAILLTALAVVSIEAAVNMAVTSVPTTSRTAYVKDNKEVEALTGKLDPGTFYRVEKSDSKTKNDGAWMNFPSASLFSSTADASLSEFFRMMGCESSTNAYSIIGSTPLVDSLFSVLYGLYPDQQPAASPMDQEGREGNVWLYKNRYTLPVAFMLPGDVEGNWVLDSGSPAQVQNDLCDVLGTSHVLLPNESETEGKNLSFTAEESGNYYVYVTNKKVKKVSAVIGEHSESYDNVDRGYFLELGYITKGQEVNLESKDEGNPALQAEVWRFNNQALGSLYDIMNASPITLTSWSDTKLEGSITADRPGTMYTSIPYDKGWTVLVDGVKVTPRTLFDTFLAVDLSQGTHEITMSYEPQGLRTGAWITGASAAILGVIALGGYCIRNKKHKKSY